MSDWKPTKAWIQRLDRQCERRSTRFDGGQLQWRIWGHGEPVLLLHGGSGSWTHWCRNIEFLSHHYQLFVPDLPGCGDSAVPQQGFDRHNIYQSTLGLARIVLDGWQQINADPSRTSYRLMGFSLGSIIATLIAGLEHNRVAQLILVGTSALGIPFGGLNGQLEPLRDDAPFEEQLGSQQHNLALIMLADSASIDAGTAWIQWNNVSRARLRTHWLASSDVVAQALPEVKSPVYAVWGERDIYSQPNPETRIEKLKLLAPAATTHCVSDGGHWVMYECADSFNAMVLPLLREQSSI